MFPHGSIARWKCMLVVRDHSAFEEKIERKNADDGQDGFDTARGSYRLPQRGITSDFQFHAVTAVKLRSSKNYLCLSGVDMRLVRGVSCLYVCPPRSTRQSGDVVARVLPRRVEHVLPGCGDSEPCL